MSDEGVIDQLDISQSGRCFYWRAQQLPLAVKEIGLHCANMHIIPANGLVRSRLRWVREGHVVRLKGYLVMAADGKGGHWVSSTRRDDSGDGSCEVVLVEDLEYR
jgi:hypothetical protein